VVGTKPQIVVQPRDLALLREIDRLRLVDREDARLLAGFGSVTRANTRLHALYLAGLLARQPAGTVLGGHKFLYALTPSAARLIGARYQPPPWNPHGTLAWSGTLEHQLAINRVYVGLRQSDVQASGPRLLRWTTFSQPISSTIRLSPDAYLELEIPDGVRAVFLEVDRGTETRRIWDRKVAAYIALATSGEFTARFGHAQFRVAVIAPSMHRLYGIRTCIARRIDKLFWLTHSRHQTRDWFAQPVWLRPHGNELHFLI